MLPTTLQAPRHVWNYSSIDTHLRLALISTCPWPVNGINIHVTDYR